MKTSTQYDSKNHCLTLVYTTPQGNTVRLSDRIDQTPDLTALRLKQDLTQLIRPTNQGVK